MQSDSQYTAGSQQPASFSSLQPSQRAWLQLIQLPGFGPITLKQLWQNFGSAEDILSTSAAQLSAQGLRNTLIHALCTQPLFESVDPELARIDAWLCQPNHHLLTLDDPRYPRALQQIADPPPLLYLVGDPELLSLPQIAIVGSRNGSAQGLENARGYGRYLSQSGLIPVSGLALGVDAAAHQGALEGMGLTVAVLGTGVDRVYPARHRALAQQIVEQGGLLVSELPLGTPPRAQHFPKRNRIISALSLGVLVVEAALKSGSLITAKQALEQGREVFALPGSIHNPLSKGCHSLIRQGALLVDSAQQVLQELAPMLPCASAVVGQLEAASGESSPDSSDSCCAEVAAADQQLLTQLGFDPVSLDQLVMRSGLPVAQLQQRLLEMELQGMVVSVAGGYQRLESDR